jgi:hypothetical protein
MESRLHARTLASRRRVQEIREAETVAICATRAIQRSALQTRELHQ